MAEFDKELDNRDVFLGDRRCVICGIADPESLRHCYIIDRSVSGSLKKWSRLKHLGWTPAGVKASTESRNGLLMCLSHRQAFHSFRFFIRFQPATKRYIFVHYDRHGVSPHLKQYHGKAIALDAEDLCAPFPLLFLVHENTVRGDNSHQPTPNVEVTSGWQKWMVRGGVVNEKVDGSFTFNREAPTLGPPPAGRSLNVQTSPTTQVASTSESRTVIMPPTVDLLRELIAYQRTMPSWKAWQREAMGWPGWEGTAELAE